MCTSRSAPSAQTSARCILASSSVVAHASASSTQVVVCPPVAGDRATTIRRVRQRGQRNTSVNHAPSRKCCADGVPRVVKEKKAVKNGEENERTRLMEVRLTGSVCASIGRTVRPHRQPLRTPTPFSHRRVTQTAVYIYLSHLQRRLLLEPLLERELHELRTRRALFQRGRRTCRSTRLVRRRRRHPSGRRRFLCGWRRRCWCRCGARTQTARRRWCRRRRRRRLLRATRRERRRWRRNRHEIVR